MQKLLRSLSWLGPKGRVAFVICFVLIVVGAIGWFVFQERISNKVEGWRAERLLEEARELAERKNKALNPSQQG